MKKRPPYSRHLNTSLHGLLLIVCTGSDAWQWAQLTTWFPGAKVVMPPGADPSAYDWRIAGEHDVMIAGCGKLEKFDRIVSLGGELLATGAKLVLYAPERGLMTRIDAVTVDD
ncbi:hypothetical protein [Methylomicrobium sp. Wu6]|uniref:hypothetical protein n=1 Tax=Methylomicrobium sp. Wu6 TaxID=3107928 RepID=UPI002DD6B2DA|nr:hypothetical protein [Methylomicrobium sp. Wu6]MEC4746935.1 hypothetical protein [Methylomicrobium sp. Wu6]